MTNDAERTISAAGTNHIFIFPPSIRPLPRTHEPLTGRHTLISDPSQEYYYIVFFPGHFAKSNNLSDDPYDDDDGES